MKRVGGFALRIAAGVIVLWVFAYFNGEPLSTLSVFAGLFTAFFTDAVNDMLPNDWKRL